VRCELDRNSYPKTIKVTDAEMANLDIETDDCSANRIYREAQVVGVKR
jgi:hypothetical protein